jgi:hypothetical protein
MFSMDGVAPDGEAFAEAIVFLSYFNDLPDPRQAGKVLYPLDEVLLLCLLAVLAGAETITDIARFGDKKLALLRRFRPFAAGTPAHDHLGDILATLDAEAFQRCFVAWVAALIGVPEGVVAIDGKTVRRSKGVAKDAVHMVSAFAARQRLVLGQVKVADKANEIVAIPKLLDMLAIEGAVVTIDAMGCQRAIAQKIVDKKADYILALKGNQGSLREDVDLFVAEQKAKDFKDTPSLKPRPSMATTAASRRATSPSSTTSDGCRCAITGPPLPALSWSRAPASSQDKPAAPTKSSAKPASTSPHWPLSRPSSDPLFAIIGLSRTASIGSSTWSSETTNAASEPTTPPPTSPPSNTRPSTLSEEPNPRTQSG